MPGPDNPRVRLLPGGEEFLVAGAQTVLEAALQAGLAVAYGCSSGNCGLCRARVVRGEVRRVRHHDFRFTEAEKLQGYALLCACAPLTDLVVEAAIAHRAAELPLQQLTAHARRIERLSDEVLLLELHTPRSARLRFLAGQSAILGLGGAQAVWPIASCPCEERRLQFHVRRAPGDSAAEYVFEQLRIGEAVALEGPVGNFVLRADIRRPMFFAALGWRGFAPVKSVIEHALSLEPPHPIELLWLGASEGEHYHANLCRAWAQAIDGFRYELRIAPEGLAVGDWLGARTEISAYDVYVAGDGPAVATARASLLAQGLPEEQLATWCAQTEVR